MWYKVKHQTQKKKSVDKQKEARSPLYGKPWMTESTHETFESADDKRKALLAPALQVKVRRLANGSFAVKTRRVPQGNKTNKTNKKSKKANKKSKKKQTN